MAKRGLPKGYRLKHGGCYTPTYMSWRRMRDRCNNPKAAGYKNYGGRGITICERWNDFANFLADMGERPEDKSLDRVDVNGNYEPTNCRWATRLEQGASRRNVRLLTLDGETHHLTEWARRKNISARTVLWRINHLGWSPELALSKPDGRTIAMRAVRGRSKPRCPSVLVHPSK